MEALERRKSKLRKRVKDKKELKRSLATNSFLVQCRTRDRAQAEETLRRAHFEVHACFTTAFYCFTTALLLVSTAMPNARQGAVRRGACVEHISRCFPAALLLLYSFFTTASLLLQRRCDEHIWRCMHALLLVCFATLLYYSAALLVCFATRISVLLLRRLCFTTETSASEGGALLLCQSALLLVSLLYY